MISGVKMKNDETEEILDLLESPEITDLVCRIYRRQAGDNAPGRPPSGVFLQKVNFAADDSYLADTFGPGSYTLHFNFKLKGERKTTTRRYEVAEDVITSNTAKKKPEQTSPQLGEVSGGLAQLGQKFLSGLTVEKMAMIGTAIKGIRDFIAPPPPATIDFVKLLEVITAINNRPQAPSLNDTIVIKALEGMQKQQSGPDIFKQFEMIERVKELVRGEERSEESGETMEYLKLAMQYLPQLLQQKKGNFEAVGAAARQNLLVKNLITSNPDLTRKFFESAVEKYGPENAKKLAEGFGYNAEFIPGARPEDLEKDSEKENSEEEESLEDADK